VTAIRSVPVPTPIRGRRAFLAAALALAAAAVACDDPFAPRAESANFNTSIEVWALTGSPTAFPTVLLVPQALVVRPDAAGSFDIGFDIDPDGRLLVVPMSKIVAPLGGGRSIGVIRTADIFNTILEAPRSGWIFDSTLSVNVGQTFLVRVTTQFCQGQLRSEVYAKYYVDSVITAERRIKLSGRVNPNCGFRSFQTGIPTY
jgi:hypothetical protein